ncbi:hypothetical protein [Streptomyces sp. NPDC008317]|uniref:VMAP-C domain-containing protein n=1 Tax=Streptomyces sp. NPDC008317 TaxID=3364827 RepID=UPI0036F0750A
MGSVEGKWTAKRLLGKVGRAGDGPGPAADGGPWPVGAAELLGELLEDFPQLSRHGDRLDLLQRMDEAAERHEPRPYGPGGARGARRARFRLDVREEFVARAHLRNLVGAIETRPDPDAALDALRAALRGQAPYDKALPWLELAVLGLTGAAPLPPDASLAVLTALRADLPHLPSPAQLARHVPHGAPGTALLTGRETLPEILVRLSDLRGGGPGGDAGRAVPLLRFLGSVTADTDLAAYARWAALRELLGALGGGRAGDTGTAGGGAQSPEAADRLIVQIRVEAAGPEHVEDGSYELRGAYYRQAVHGGPLRRVAALPPSEPFRRSELTGAGSARMSAWTELAREVRGAGGGVRVEFLLPEALLGYSAELWSAGPTRTPLGQHHPVVVRSLERYTDSWVIGAWRQRWQHLRRDPQRAAAAPHGGGNGDTAGTGAREADPADDALGRISWPRLHGRSAATELTESLVRQPELACLGLTVPYDRLSAHLLAAVKDALYTEGVPVMLWRRDPGDPRELVTALRAHPPARLLDLPETVHRCRKYGRTAGADDVRNNITLLWDDPDSVDADQDTPYAGMA